MKTIIRFSCITLLFFNSVSALFGGGAFIIDPLGEFLQAPLGLLKHSPFETFLIPGIILFTFIGISSLVVAVLVIKSARSYPLALVYQGIVNIIWIIVQLIMIRQFDALQAVYFCLGAILIPLGIYSRKRN